MQRAALRRLEGVAERARFEERPALRGRLGGDQLERIAALLQPFAILLGLVAGLARHAQEAARIVMAFAKVAPQLVPGAIGLGDGAAVAAGLAVGAADDAVVVAGRGKRVGDGALLDQGDLMPAPGERPRRRQSGDARPDHDHLHALPFFSGPGQGRHLTARRRLGKRGRVGFAMNDTWTALCDFKDFAPPSPGILSPARGRWRRAPSPSVEVLGGAPAPPSLRGESDFNVLAEASCRADLARGEAALESQERGIACRYSTTHQRSSLNNPAVRRSQSAGSPRW